jgi:hypothetical protein
MQKSILIFFLLLGSLAGICQAVNKTTDKRTIQVKFNRNIEFMGFTFFLGSAYMGQLYENNEELTAGHIKKKDWYAYDLALYQQYKSFLGNKHLETAVHFLEKLDGADLILLLVQLDNFPQAELKENIAERYLLPFSDKKDPIEGRKNVTLFIESLNRFYQEINFDQYFIVHSKHYESALQQIKKGLPSSAFIPAMENFYRQQFNDYILLPSLTIPTGMGFGAKLVVDNQTKIYNAFGPFSLQHFTDTASLDMGFGDKKRLRELSTHEFGHSFSNPIVDKISPQWIEETARLFEPVKTAMEDQGYPSWKYCLYEHFVRASEVVIARNMGYSKEAAGLQKHYIEDRKFIYLPLIIEQLTRYNQNKNISYQEAVMQAMEKLKTKATEN